MKNKPYTDADIQCITENMHLTDNAMKKELLKDFTRMVRKMRETQKTAYVKSKFEPDKLEWMRAAHEMERQVDAHLERLEV